MSKIVWKTTTKILLRTWEDNQNWISKNFRIPEKSPWNFRLCDRAVHGLSLISDTSLTERETLAIEELVRPYTQKSSGVPQYLSARRRHSSQKSIGKVDIPWWMWHYYLDKNWPHNNPIVMHRDRSSSMKTNSIVNTHLTGASCSTQPSSTVYTAFCQ